MTSETNLEKYVDLILDNWNWAKGFCSDCPFNVVDGYPGFAFGDKDVDVLVVGQNPGGNGTKRGRRRKVGSKPTKSSHYFRRALQELMDYEDNGKRHDIVEVLEAMTKETRFEDFDSLYITNVCKCHSYDEWDSGLSKAINHCSFYLAGEIAFSRPKLIVAFGKYASLEVSKLLGLHLEGIDMGDLHCRYRHSRRFPLGVLFFRHWGRKGGTAYRTQVNNAFRKHRPQSSLLRCQEKN